MKKKARRGRPKKTTRKPRLWKIDDETLKAHVKERFDFGVLRDILLEKLEQRRLEIEETVSEMNDKINVLTEVIDGLNYAGEE